MITSVSNGRGPLGEEGILTVFHFTCISMRWHPFGRVSWADLGHTHIGLLERQALELGDEEICKCDAKAAETTPKEEHLRTKGSLVIADKVWCDDG